MWNVIFIGLTKEKNNLRMTCDEIKKKKDLQIL